MQNGKSDDMARKRTRKRSKQRKRRRRSNGKPRPHNTQDRDPWTNVAQSINNKNLHKLLYLNNTIVHPHYSIPKSI